MIKPFATIIITICLLLFAVITCNGQEVPRNMVLTEVFVGTWSLPSKPAVQAFEDLANNNSPSATITYLNLDNLE